MPARPVHTSIHRWGPAEEGLRYCEVCELANFACGDHSCSGIRNILGRPTQDLPDREDARLSAGSVACASTENAPTGSPPAAPRSGKKRRGISPASPAQRNAVRWRACLVCGIDRYSATIDPAHIIPRSRLSEGQDDARAVVALCRVHHNAYDRDALDLLPYLGPTFSAEIAFAVERFGLLPTLRQVTGQRWVPECAA